MRVLVCGSRDWTDRDAIRRELTALPAGTTVVHGAARGADSIAGEIAREMGLAVEEHPADWNRWGKSAGARRNSAMLAAGKYDCALAFRLDGVSAGTDDMVRKLARAKVATKVVRGARP